MVKKMWVGGGVKGYKLKRLQVYPTKKLFPVSIFVWNREASVVLGKIFCWMKTPGEFIQQKNFSQNDTRFPISNKNRNWEEYFVG